MEAAAAAIPISQKCANARLSCLMVVCWYAGVCSSFYRNWIFFVSSTVCVHVSSNTSESVKIRWQMCTMYIHANFLCLINVENIVKRIQTKRHRRNRNSCDYSIKSIADGWIFGNNSVNFFTFLVTHTFWKCYFQSKIHAIRSEALFIFERNAQE